MAVASAGPYANRLHLVSGRTCSNRESFFRKKKNCESFHDTRAGFLSKVTFESDFERKLSSVSLA